MGINIKKKFIAIANKIQIYLNIINKRWNEFSDKQKNIILGTILGIFAIFIWLQYDLFNFPLTTDMGLYFYGGRELLQGNIPYVNIFDVKPPMTFFVSAAGISISNMFNLDPVVIGPRILFLFFGSGTVFFTYLLTYHLFKDRFIAILSAIILISFTGFGWASLSGRPQIIMVFFAIICLYATIRKKWFIAGIFGSLSALTWQPGALYPIIVVIYSLADKQDRKNNLIKTIIGVSLPLLFVVIFFLIMGGLNEMFTQTVLLTVSFKSTLHWGFFRSTFGAIFNMIYFYGTEILFFIAGFLGFIFFVYKKRKNIINLKSPIPLIIFSFLPQLIYISFDFQWWPDFIHLLPYFALFASYIIIKFGRKIANLIQNKIKFKGKKTVTYFTIAIIIISTFYGILPEFFESESTLENITNEVIEKGDYEKIIQLKSEGNTMGVISVLIEDIGFFSLINKFFFTTKSLDTTLPEQIELAKYIEKNLNSNQQSLFIGVPNLLFLSNCKNFGKYVLYPADILYMQSNDELSAFRDKIINEKPQFIASFNFSCRINYTNIFYNVDNINNIPPELELDEFIKEEYEIVKQSKDYDIYARK